MHKLIDYTISFHIGGCPFKKSTDPREEGSALFSVLLMSYILDMGREGSKNGEKLSKS